MKDFKDKVVVITGGGTGIGFSFAKRFGAEGARIVISGRRLDRLEQAAEQLAELGIEASPFACDVTDRAHVEALADHAWTTYGQADVIVNNAGVSQEPTPVLDTDPEVFRWVYGINVHGVVNGSTVFGKRFIEQGSPAAIYNVGSENSLFHGVPTGAAYVSSKHAVLAITESLAEEVPDFIEVGLICPGFVLSELGDSDIMAAGMDTDRYTAIAMEQIKNGEFFIVSHAYNMVRIEVRYDAIRKAFERYAPRYEGDQEFDVRTLFAAMAARGQG